MRTRPDLSVVIPAYNEEHRLPRTLAEIAAYAASTGRDTETLVVDDGSRDRTGAVVRALAEEMPGLRLIRLPANRGKGYAVRAGMVNARGAAVLMADADGATPIAELERLEAALETGAQVAIGSREVHASGVQVRVRAHRRLMGRTFHLLVEALAVRGFHDTQCGFKLFRADAAQDLFTRMRMDGFSFDVELLLMARLRGYRVAEVPVNWTHVAGSRVNLVADSLRMAADLLVIRGLALRGAYDLPRMATLVEPAARPESAPALTGGG